MTNANELQGCGTNDTSRRRFLAATGAVAGVGLAGCSSDDGGDSDADGDGGDGGTDEANVVLQEDELVDREDGTTQIDFVAENTGGKRAGKVTLNYEWFDADGATMDQSFKNLYFLDAGQQWNDTI